MRHLLGLFFSPLGLLALSLLDSSPFAYVPFANDVVVVVLAARDPYRFWLYPLLATAGAVAGSALTYWVGERLGETGVEHLRSGRVLRAMQARVRGGGAITLGLAALIPPPFPLTVLVLCSGALEVERKRFFLTLFLARLLRYGVLAVAALRFGRHILRLFRSDAVKGVAIAIAAAFVLATAYTAYQAVRRLRFSGRAPAC